MTSNEDFLFAQEALALGFVTEAQVEEALELQRRMADDLQLDERLAVLLVKRGYLAEDQARRVYGKIQPDKGGPGEIHGYRLLEVVGRGAMGTVYRAQHIGLAREVAIKILRPDLAGDRTQVERLKAEATMLASLDHPNIVRALDAGESNGFPYVVMEFVEGESLRDRLRREGHLDETEALRITRALADALERARRKGVVHRDVKPGNILLTKTGTPKLMDLGLAKGPIDLGLTQHGATVGTPQYIAPEQALDPKTADTRSDIYALGATLYAMLTGEPPFDGKTLAEILTKVLYEAPVPVRTRRPEISREVGYLVERMMLRDPSLRYRTPALVVADIDRLTQGTSILPTGFSGNWEGFLLRKRARRVLGVLGIAAAVVVVGGVAWKLAADREESSKIREMASNKVRTFYSNADPVEGKVDVQRRKAALEELLPYARRADSPELVRLEGDLRRYDEDLVQYAKLQTLHETTVDPAQRERDFLVAESALRAFFETSQFEVRHTVEAQLADLRHASDEALAEDRREAFRRSPKDVDEVEDATRGWAARVASRYAKTSRRDEEVQSSAAARKAAERIAGAVRTGLASVSDARLDEGVAQLRFAALLDDVRAARETAEQTRVEQGEALTGAERGYVTPIDLTRVVAAPFAERREAVSARAASAWKALQATVAATKNDDPDGVLALLDQFVQAASRDGAFPELAQAARLLFSDIDAESKSRREAAEFVRRKAVSDVVHALRAHDLDEIDRAVARARKEPIDRRVERELDELARPPLAMRKLVEGAFNVIVGHRTSDHDPSRWFPTLQFRGDAQNPNPPPEQFVEIRDAFPDFSFEYVTHRGKGTQPGGRRLVTDLDDEQLFRLVEMDPSTAEGAWLFAVLAVANRPVTDENFYVALLALDEAGRRFRAAHLEDSPLARWVEEERAKRDAQAHDAEGRALSNLDSARKDMDDSLWGSARWHLSALLDRPLRWTRVVEQSLRDVESRIRQIDGEFDKDHLGRFWPGAKIKRRDGAPPGVLEVEAYYSFDDRTPLAAQFVSGWAKRELAPASGRTITPGSGPNNALRLSPPPKELGRETVADRPLVLDASCLDAKAARSVSFLYFPDQPLVLVVDLDGVQVAVFSDDPTSHEFGKDVPLFPDEARLPKYDVFGHGRGVLFHTGMEIGDPAKWGWDDGYQGRHFVPPALASDRVRPHLSDRWFAFQNRPDKPYLVKFTWEPEGGVRLEVDDKLVLADSHFSLSALNGKAPSSGKIQILTYTSCVIDDLKVSGRIDPAWLEKQKESAKPTSR